MQNSGVVERWKGMPPASMMRVTSGWVSSAMLSAKSGEPSVAGRPAMGCSSLMITGRPSSGRAVPST